MKKGELTINAEKYPKMPDEIDLGIKQTFDKSNFIHPTAIIGSNVKMGKNNFIGAYCIIQGNTRIGNGNEFISYCSIGFEPEHKAFFGKKNQGVIIGNNNYFREFITINSGCENPTVIEDDVIMLRGSHVGHDSKIMRNATLSCNVIIGGHSLVGIFVNMGLGSVCHQYSRIPHYCMIGMNTTITKSFKALAFEKYIGSPAKCIGVNFYWSKQFSIADTSRIIDEFNNEKLNI